MRPTTCHLSGWWQSNADDSKWRNTTIIYWIIDHANDLPKLFLFCSSSNSALISIPILKLISTQAHLYCVTLDTLPLSGVEKSIRAWCYQVGQSLICMSSTKGNNCLDLQDFSRGGSNFFKLLHTNLHQPATCHHQSFQLFKMSNVARNI